MFRLSGVQSNPPVDPDDISAIKPYNDEAIKQFEADGWDNEPWRQCPARDYAGRSAIPGWAAAAA